MRQLLIEAVRRRTTESYLLKNYVHYRRYRNHSSKGERRKAGQAANQNDCQKVVINEHSVLQLPLCQKGGGG